MRRKIYRKDYERIKTVFEAQLKDAIISQFVSRNMLIEIERQLAKCPTKPTSKVEKKSISSAIG